MTEQETVFKRPNTVVDVMFGNMVSYLGTAAKVVTQPAARAHENLQGYRQMEMRRILEMFGLRARKFRTPLRRRYLLPRGV